MEAPSVNPALSVIIPAYNRADFVRECLASLRSSGVSDLEVIVVDDGSTDDTAEAVAATCPQAIYLIQKNQGPAAARNNGFRQSRGRYLCFLDCDDEWLPHVAAHMVDVLERHPVIDVLFADAQMGNRVDGFQSWIEVAGQQAFTQLPQHRLEEGLSIFEREPLLKRLLVRNCVFLGSTILRREAYERSGGFDPALCGAADWNLWLRLAAQTTFAFYGEPLAIYTKHPDGMSLDADGMCREFCMALHKLSEQVILQPEARTIRDQQLRHHLFNYAYRAYDRGDYPVARRRFRQLLRDCGCEGRGFLYLLLSSLPFGIAGWLRSFKHTLAGEKRAAVAEGIPASKAVLTEHR